MKRAAVALVLLAAILAGCGSGGGSSTGRTVAAPVSASTATRQVGEAEALCGKMLADAHSLGRKALATDAARYSSSLEFTTEALIAPGLPVVERTVRELRSVTAGGAEPQLSAFVAMFDPIVSLLEERLKAGRQGDAAEAHEIEAQVLELSQIQRTLAKEAGLKSCETDFVGAFAQPKG